ncbi:uncharacterized protein [Antedon mediterranea]|uniref:uncharacterized protein n=1 Tax=Antedon mediterranea TaxID=105859 RepID=UPI003AF89A46
MANSVNTLKKNLEQVMISGYLTRGHEEMKDKPFKKKHKKFYVLRYKENEFATIYEYKDDKDFAAEKPKHAVDTVPLLRSTKLHLFDHIEIHKHKYENILCVLMRKDMALYLQADSKKIAQQWYTSLNRIIADLGHKTEVGDPDPTIHRTQSVPTPVTTKIKRNERKSSPAAMEDTFHPLKKKTIDVIDENATIDTVSGQADDDAEYLIPNVSQEDETASSSSTSPSLSRAETASPDFTTEDDVDEKKCKCCDRNHIECEQQMPGYMNIHQVSNYQEHFRAQETHREVLCRERDQYSTLAEVSRQLHERANQRQTEQIQTGYNPLKSPDLPLKSTSQTNISSVGGWPLISSTSMPSIPPPTPPRPKKQILVLHKSDDEDDDLPEPPPAGRLRLRRSSSTSQLAEINTFMDNTSSMPPRHGELIPPSLPPRRDFTDRLAMPELANGRSISPNSRTMDRRHDGLVAKDFNAAYASMDRVPTPPNSLPISSFLTVKQKSPLKISPRSPTRYFFPESPPESPKPEVFRPRRILYEQDFPRKMSTPTPPSSPFLERRKISNPQPAHVFGRQKHQSPTQPRKMPRTRRIGIDRTSPQTFTDSQSMRADNSTIDVTDRPLPPRPEGMDVEKISRTMDTILWEKTKEDGIPIPIRKSDLIDKLALVKFNDYIWIAGKRSSKERSALDKLHIGDHLWRINDQIVVDPKTAQDMIRTSAKEEVTLYIKRLPHAKIVTVKRSSQSREWGIKCLQNEVKSVSPSGPAFECGVTPNTNCVSNSRLCNWCITEINFNWFRLTGIGKDQINKKLAEITNLELTLTLQPSDFVKELKTRIEKLPNAHVFTLPRS